jgi:hypothetical protein
LACLYSRASAHTHTHTHTHTRLCLALLSTSLGLSPFPLPSCPPPSLPLSLSPSPPSPSPSPHCILMFQGRLARAFSGICAAVGGTCRRRGGRDGGPALVAAGNGGVSVVCPSRAPVCVLSSVSLYTVCLCIYTYYIVLSVFLALSLDLSAK